PNLSTNKLSTQNINIRVLKKQRRNAYNKTPATRGLVGRLDRLCVRSRRHGRSNSSSLPKNSLEVNTILKKIRVESGGVTKSWPYSASSSSWRESSSRRSRGFRNRARTSLLWFLNPFYPKRQNQFKRGVLKLELAHILSAPAVIAHYTAKRERDPSYKTRTE
ncbi:hypothetical protein SDJN02_23587, partial [Cucurbita argyrosperma subsp. argyrosperma]